MVLLGKGDALEDADLIANRDCVIIYQSSSIYLLRYGEGKERGMKGDLLGRSGCSSGYLSAAKPMVSRLMPLGYMLGGAMLLWDMSVLCGILCVWC